MLPKFSCHKFNNFLKITCTGISADPDFSGGHEGMSEYINVFEADVMPKIRADHTFFAEVT